ncbi:DEAD/DEAH box helicase [Legionella taurinensis]|uniref:DEAD/DEAH box helicase n=1 Tax=Legionella taurinensis TaxID=70611 RepID=UPI00299E860B|nr:DEAD/DEAH box helicase family protein [Legionella taurinensis]MDX1838832.1 DEAD/DEAH box helicase family protein [Legionella taurinensis]
MTYFQRYSTFLKISENTSPKSGLRLGQVGALYALAGHFIEKDEPAIVSLPTGYGKTAVLLAICFLIRAKRVLVVTSTVTLRDQTIKAFETLEQLRELNVLTEDVSIGPKVTALQCRVTSQEEWESLKEFDVIVCTPQSSSPEIKGIPPPPKEFFDLVLVDEGHHSPARTWRAIVNKTSHAHHALFSATPFRRDRKEVLGRLIFYYPLERAVKEKVFGKVQYCPVNVDECYSKNECDLELIHKALEIFNRDKNAGFQHRILARTERVRDAERLEKMYIEAGLNVEAIHSKKTKQKCLEIEKKLISGELDGVVCVDMFGEGYDFPKFKIAVLHDIHKSLVPTLQFIGRFARTNDEHTGTATFLAIPRDIKAESAELYKEGVDWEVLLTKSFENRHQLELKERELFSSFHNVGHPSLDYDAIMLGEIYLSQHISAYKITKKPDFSKVPEELKSLKIIKSFRSADKTTLIFLTKLVRPPLWYRDNHIIDSKHECFLIKYFSNSKLLFISATEHASSYYNEILKFFVKGTIIALSFEEIRKVLNGIKEQEFFTVGLRSTSPVAITESYRIVAGRNADRGIRNIDSVNFAQGHFMCKSACKNDPFRGEIGVEN